MGLEAWFTICVLILVIAALVSNRMGMDIALLSGLIILMVVGVVDVHDAASGFASEAVLMIAGLYVFAAGMQETGCLCRSCQETPRSPLQRLGGTVQADGARCTHVGFHEQHADRRNVHSTCEGLVEETEDQPFIALHASEFFRDSRRAVDHDRHGFQPPGDRSLP